jgi:hypothetical protein
MDNLVCFRCQNEARQLREPQAARDQRERECRLRLPNKFAVGTIAE